MKKIIKLCMVGFLAITLVACGSSDEKEAKSVVSDYLSALKDKDLSKVSEINGEEYDSSLENDDLYMRRMSVMLDRFDYDVTEANINADDAAVTVDITNINYTSFKNTTNSIVQSENENFDELELADKDLKLLEVQERELPNTETVTQTVTVYLIRNGDSWKLASENADMNLAIFGQ